MLTNYIKIALRMLLRNRSYAIINILGLSVGIASALMIFLVIRFEESFDTFHSKKDRIARIVTEFNRPEGVRYSAGVPFPTADGLRAELPQLERVASVFATTGQITVMDGGTIEKKFNEEHGLFFAEPDLFDILDFPSLAGDPADALRDPHGVCLTRETAERYFGDWKSALGKTLMYRNRDVYTVRGILENVPGNSDFPFRVVMSYASFRGRNPGNFSDWVTVFGSHECFALLPSGMAPAQLDGALAAFARRHKPVDYTRDGLIAQPLGDVHFDGRFDNFNERVSSRELLTALGLIGLFLLVIACANFINLATAQAANRAREVGVRKVLGGDRRKLALQFMIETALLTASSLAVALAITEVLLPPLNRFLRMTLTLDLRGGSGLALFLPALLAGVTLLSGFYPALVLSGYSPINALRRKAGGMAGGGISLRRGLVVFQFVITQVLLIGMLVVVRQIDYFRSAPLGYDREAVVVVPIPPDSASRVSAPLLKSRLLAESGIAGVSVSSFSPSDPSHWNSDFRFDGSPKNTEFEAELKWADADYIGLYGMQCIAGRPYVQSDSAREFVVNESLVRALGIRSPEEAIGRQIDFWNGQIVAPIVGVVRDFHTRSFRYALAPVVLGCWKNSYQTLNVKIRLSGRGETLKTLERLWSQTYPKYVYEFKFMDDVIDEQYRDEDRISDMYKVFASTAILISCLGLFGLVSFTSVQRTKEVGIRKVLGASVANIVILLSREFALLVGLSFVVAAPVAWILMDGWLRDYAYRITIGAGTLALAGGASLVVALLTVSYHAVRAALANPVDALHYE